MTRKTFFLLTILGLISAMGYSSRDDLAQYAHRMLSEERELFEPITMPSNYLLQLYDMGIVDANSDGYLDIYTSAHNYRQNLWLADGKGGYQDSLTAWELDQNSAMPGIEQSEEVPVFDKPGLYIYWQGDVLNLVAHQTDGLEPLRGSIKLYDDQFEVLRSNGFHVNNSVVTRSTPDTAPVSRLNFSATGNGTLAVYLSTRGAPITFRIDAPWARSHVYVGTQRIVPSDSGYDLLTAGGEGDKSEEKAVCAGCLIFDLFLLDRHGLAWSDYNDDGQLDIYITRGAFGGTLRKFPAEVRDRVSDEMLVSEGAGRFVERLGDLGFKKNDCSGRHVRWVDYNQDGLLDLYINCLDRGKLAGGFPKQLYQQKNDHRFMELAEKVGLDVPDNEFIDFAWLDADGDGDVDLLTHEDQGFFLYTQQTGHFTRNFIYRSAFERSDVKGLKNNTYDYWQFDGKLSMADFDNDGDMDAFIASKRGNTFLVNQDGHFKEVDPNSLGLPKASVAATWVDYDNDGLLDLHTVPEGLFHQEKDQHFTTTDIFALSRNKYQAAFIHWFDMDNDGKLDVLMALQDNATLWRWWEMPFKSKNVKGKDDRFRWKLLAYRNVGAQGHWLQMELRGARGNREAIGTRVTLVTSTGLQGRLVGSNESSYFSQGHYRQYFGLGDQTRIDHIELQWPDGPLHKIENVNVDQVLKVARDVAQ